MDSREVADMVAWREKHSLRRQTRIDYRRLAKWAVLMIIGSAIWGLLIGLWWGRVE